MTRISERHVYPLVGVYANRFHGPRFALVGDAAVGMHPVTAHGFNLGLTSVAHLAARLIPAHRAGRDPGASELLESYPPAPTGAAACRCSTPPTWWCRCTPTTGHRRGCCAAPP